LNLSSNDDDGEEGMPVVCVNGAKGICVAVTDDNADEEKKEGNPMLDGRLSITKELFHEPVPATVMEKTLQLAIQNGFTVNYYVNHFIYAQSTQPLHQQCIHAYMNLTGVDIITSNDNYQTAKQIGLPSKLLVLTGEERLDEAVSFFSNTTSRSSHRHSRISTLLCRNIESNSL